MLYVVIIILSMVILALILKVYALKKSSREIAEGFKARIRDDTNQPVFVSSRDKDICALVKSINVQLGELRREQLEYRNGSRELKTAVTNISHDLRTPLTAICGYLYMIKKTDDREQIAGYLSVIEERAEAMKQLTEELFRYSVMISEDETPELEEVNVGQLLEDSIMGYFGALEEKGIVPDVNITESTVIRKLNKACLSRIFANLLNNALKYSNGDLSITLSDAGVITFSNMAEELSSVQAEQLFDRFYTVRAARNSTGLGLSISRTLVERMGGTITAEYDKGRLTIVIFFDAE
jgi:hypothetical protein